MTLKPDAQRSRASLAATLGLVAILHGSPSVAAALVDPPLPQTNNPSMAALDRIGRQIAKRVCDRPNVTLQGKAASASASTARVAAAVDVTVVYSCPGYRVVAQRHRIAGMRSEVVTAVELSASHPAVDATIGIGADVRSVIKALGAPDTVAGDDLFYPLSSDQPEAFQALIRIRNERVVAIIWRWLAR
jgi:hypothetical protein